MTNFGPQPQISDYTINDPSVYGNHNPYDRGYGVKTPDTQAGQGGHANTWNAILVDPYGQSVKLWITDFETSFALSGQTAQSRHTRQFFPHSFTQPTVTVTGQMPNNFQYNRLAAFVRNSHAIALNIDSQARQQRMSTQNVSARHYNDGTPIPTVSLRVRGGGTPALHNAKGIHKGQWLDGYIQRIDAGGERFKNAPGFTFDFVVAYSRFIGNTGIYQDSLSQGSDILPWIDIFKAGFQGDASKAAYTLGQDVGNAVDNLGHTVQQIGTGIENAIGGIGDLFGGL